jgi:hypothetical protein
MNYYFKKANASTLVVTDELGTVLIIDIQCLNSGDEEGLRKFLLQDMKPDFWGYHLQGEYKLLTDLLGKVDVFPKYIKELAQEADTLQLPEKLYPTKVYNKEEDKFKKSAEFVKWCYRLHRAISTYQDQIKDQEKELKYQALATEMEFALKSYEAAFNHKNKDQNFKIDLKLQTRPLMRDAFDKNACISKAMLTLTVTENGVPRIASNKVHGFRTEAEEAARFDWGLKLYREMLYEIIGMGIMLDQIKWNNRDELAVTV